MISLKNEDLISVVHTTDPHLLTQVLSCLDFYISSPFAASIAAACIYKFVFLDDDHESTEELVEKNPKKVHLKDSGSEEP